MITEVERLARVEVEVTALKESLEEYKQETNQRLDKMDKKLDDLLALRNKGAGVLWFIGGAAFFVVELLRYFWGK